MKNFNKGGGRFGGGGFKRDFKRQEFGRGPSTDRFEMHKAVCSTCGNDCEVPFRPTSGKPVYCNKCFKASRGTETNRYEGKSEEKKYNNFSESTNERRNGNSEEQLKRQFETLNWKLDKIVKILTPVVPLEVIQKKIEKKASDLEPKKKKSPVKV